MSLLAPKTFEVVYLDGRRETITLQRLSLRQLYRFIELLGGKDPGELVALCTGRTAEWFDTLEDESGAALSHLCSSENFPRAGKLAEKDPLAGLRMAPFFQLTTAAISAADTLGRTGRNSLPGQPPSTSAGETSTPVSTSLSTDSSPCSPPKTDSAPKTG